MRFPRPKMKSWKPKMKKLRKSRRPSIDKSLKSKERTKNSTILSMNSTISSKMSPISAKIKMKNTAKLWKNNLANLIWDWTNSVRRLVNKMIILALLRLKLNKNYQCWLRKITKLNLMKEFLMNMWSKLIIRMVLIRFWRMFRSWLMLISKRFIRKLRN